LPPSFLFYKIGKTVILKVLKSIAAAQKRAWKFSSIPTGDLGVNIGQPSTHPLYNLLLNGNYSDFKIKLNNVEYQLHKCILFVQSGYFQSFLKSDWKESSSGEITIPGNDISKKSFEVFLAFLYTGYMTEKDLETYLFELYDLSDYFQVQPMKFLVLNGFEKYLTNITAESFLKCIRDREIYELKGRMADYLAAHFMELLKVDFPFYKVGKIILQLMVSRTAAYVPIFSLPLPSSIGDSLSNQSRKMIQKFLIFNNFELCIAQASQLVDLKHKCCLSFHFCFECNIVKPVLAEIYKAGRFVPGLETKYKK
jgi:hypothetical protein